MTTCIFGYTAWGHNNYFHKKLSGPVDNRYMWNHGFVGVL